jgi:hypothetical protein
MYCDRDSSNGSSSDGGFRRIISSYISIRGSITSILLMVEVVLSVVVVALVVTVVVVCVCLRSSGSNTSTTKTSITNDSGGSCHDSGCSSSSSGRNVCRCGSGSSIDDRRNRY